LESVILDGKVKTVKNLKYIGMVAVVLAAAGSMQQAQADEGAGPTAITGSISFIGTATTDGSSIASATEFTSIVAKVKSDSGDYALVPSSAGPTPGVTTLTSTGVLNVMTDYSFDPSQNTVTPLWDFTSGGITYSFDATTLTAVFNTSADAWDISGLGDAFITGGNTDYAETPGTWSAVVSGSTSSFNFGSAEDPPGPATVPRAPDGGLTVGLLGGVMVGLYVFRRKLT
jgi:hypothetical protein